MANKPTPTALKKLAGNPGKRPLNRKEPQPVRCVPACPDWMPADGVLEWARVVPELDRLGVLTKVDAGVLEGYCALYSEFVGAVRIGEPLKAALMAQMRVYACEMGLTPAARAKLIVPQGGDDDPAEEFFR